MKEIKMQYSVTITIDEDGPVTKAYAFDVPGVAVEYGSPVSAVAKIRKAVAQRIDALIQESDEKYRQEHMIFTMDGHTLLVRYRYGSWGYFVCGPDRKGPSSTWGQKTFREACAYAVDHAEQSYGGVLGEMGM